MTYDEWLTSISILNSAKSSRAIRTMYMQLGGGTEFRKFAWIGADRSKRRCDWFNMTIRDVVFTFHAKKRIKQRVGNVNINDIRGELLEAFKAAKTSQIDYQTYVTERAVEIDGNRITYNWIWKYKAGKSIVLTTYIKTKKQVVLKYIKENWRNKN